MFNAGDKKIYYIMKPVNQNESTVYYPVDGAEKRIRYPISATEAQKLLNSDFKAAVKWESNEMTRRTLFDGILAEKIFSG